MIHEDNHNRMLPPKAGTQLKLAVTADLGSTHLKDVDFECRFFRRGRPDNGVSVGKDKMRMLNDDEYLAVVDTKRIGPGELLMELTAWIPDGDVEGGQRREQVVVSTGIHVY